jgi:subtilisin family serine protease
LVSDIARFVAPGASRNEYNFATLNSSQNITTMASDVITTSSGFFPLTLVTYPSLVSYEANLISAMEASNALVTVAAQHSNWVGGTHAQLTTSPNPNSGPMTVSNCNTWALKGLDSSNVIYVGEVDANDNIPLTDSLSSNQAGDTHKNQFIVTSSDYITTARDGGTHGNSFAAPRVAGTAALVRHKFPNLSGAQTATTILHTADDLGVAGVDAVYGHGKLNVGKALAPVGNLH